MPAPPPILGVRLSDEGAAEVCFIVPGKKASTAWRSRPGSLRNLPGFRDDPCSLTSPRREGARLHRISPPRAQEKFPAVVGAKRSPARGSGHATAVQRRRYAARWFAPCRWKGRYQTGRQRFGSA